jgi:hypothetical protein
MKKMIRNQKARLKKMQETRQTRRLMPLEMRAKRTRRRMMGRRAHHTKVARARRTLAAKKKIQNGRTNQGPSLKMKKSE